jgi:alpha-beta hydrolase superfamily lysophospholipase
MKKASKPTVDKKPTAKKPMQKQPLAKLANSKKAQGGAGLTEVVAQLAQSAEKLAQAAERLAEATARLSITAEARHEILETRGPSTADPTASPQECEASEVTNSQ